MLQFLENDDAILENDHAIKKIIKNISVQAERINCCFSSSFLKFRGPIL